MKMYLLFIGMGYSIHLLKVSLSIKILLVNGVTTELINDRR
jgi:hypothetical protein